MTDTTTYLTIRNLPRKLHVAMTRLAKVSRRSLNAQVVIAIEEHVAAYRGQTFVSDNDRAVRAKKGRTR